MSRNLERTGLCTDKYFFLQAVKTATKEKPILGYFQVCSIQATWHTQLRWAHLPKIRRHWRNTGAILTKKETSKGQRLNSICLRSEHLLWSPVAICVHHKVFAQLSKTGSWRRHQCWNSRGISMHKWDVLVRLRKLLPHHICLCEPKVWHRQPAIAP